MIQRSQVLLALKGLAMGMAEVVPGVSGGTIAFITGIYETLINTIKSIVRLPFGAIFKRGFASFWREINGTWLVALLVGMVIGILIGVVGITHLLERFPPIVWGFFFGLIVSSSIYIGRKVEHWSASLIVLLVIGICIAYGFTTVTPVTAAPSYLFLFLAGAVAISALILPGISGSFILLLLGLYTYVVSSVKSILTEFDFTNGLPILVFALGCFVGLALFSNLLSWTFKNYKNETLAVLTGFMIGSLNRIWPWRNVERWLDELTGEQVTILPSGAVIDDFKILQESNVWSSAYEGTPYVFAALIAFLLGLLLVFWLSKVDPENAQK